MFKPASHWALFAAFLSLAAVRADAVAVDGEILRDDSGNDSFSFIDDLATQDRFLFAPGEPFEFDFSDGGVISAGDQSYLVETSGGTSALIEIVQLDVDTNGANGFASGSVQLRFDGGQEFGIVFRDDVPANRSVIADGTLTVFLIGVNRNEGKQFNFVFSGALPQIPEPGMLALLALGALSFGLRRRRRG
jgi:hypothetical protein